LCASQCLYPEGQAEPINEGITVLSRVFLMVFLLRERRRERQKGEKKTKKKKKRRRRRRKNSQ
jgi:hypothetical protein